MHLLFDIGGTRTRVALSKDGLGFEEPIIFSTPQDFSQGIQQLKRSWSKTTQRGARYIHCRRNSRTVKQQKNKTCKRPKLAGMGAKAFIQRTF